MSEDYPFSDPASKARIIEAAMLILRAYGKGQSEASLWIELQDRATRLRPDAWHALMAEIQLVGLKMGIAFATWKPEHYLACDYVFRAYAEEEARCLASWSVGSVRLDIACCQRRAILAMLPHSRL